MTQTHEYSRFICLSKNHIKIIILVMIRNLGDFNNWNWSVFGFIFKYSFFSVNVGYSISSSSACSSGGPSSPTSVSSPDDVMRKLKQLIDHGFESECTSAPSDPSESEGSNVVESSRPLPGS